ncbi:MAG TPA: GNAT family N-acetyltransferase [Vulgatibacter sp.]
MAHLEVRAANAADYDDYCRLLPELRTGDPVPTREAREARIAPETMVLEADGAVIASGWVRVLRTWAHVVHVIVDPAWQGRGIGRRLMDALADRLRGAGCTHWYLNVKRDNVAALRLYASAGFAGNVETAVLRIPWSILPSLPTAADAPPPATIAPDEDDGCEAQFGLAPGSIQAARARGDLPFRLGDPARAFAVFNPSFPGAWCFRAAEPALVRPLLDALRPHAPAAVPHVMAVTEDPGVAEALVAGGAELRMELYRLSGPIPGAPPRAQAGAEGERT